MRRNPVRHSEVRERVPSGVMARANLSDVLNLSTSVSNNYVPPFFLTTGTPPIERKIAPKGKKNHVDFIRNPACRPREA